MPTPLPNVLEPLTVIRHKPIILNGQLKDHDLSAWYLTGLYRQADLALVDQSLDYIASLAEGRPWFDQERESHGKSKIIFEKAYPWGYPVRTHQFTRKALP